MGIRAAATWFAVPTINADKRRSESTDLPYRLLIYYGKGALIAQFYCRDWCQWEWRGARIAIELPRREKGEREHSGCESHTEADAFSPQRLARRRSVDFTRRRSPCGEV
jgi:hypothetical protein